MTFLSALYTLIIGPLELFFEVVFALAYKVVSHPGAAIVVLSLAMNFLVLPLYMRADKMQAEQMAIEKRLQPWIKHIKKTFRGDERFMMLQTYYRQNDYKPTDALKGSISLLLEIPFFIAAYRFLSGLALMKGVSMGPIADLGSPDALIVIGSLSMNLLPILMTVINIISSAIYTKGMPLKSKLQLYIIALIFLVFLYNSPAGLVFYWTLNNLFSLVKNLCYKFAERRRAMRGMEAQEDAGSHAAKPKPKRQIFARFGGTGGSSLKFANSDGAGGSSRKFAPSSRRRAKSSAAFYMGCIFLALFEGLFIPINVIKASPAEFIDRTTMTNPLQYVASSAILAIGFFVLWFAVFYMLATPKGKDIMGCLIWILAGIAVINFMLFGRDLGNMSALLVYDNYPTTGVGEILLNLLIVAAVAAIFVFVWKFLSKLPSAVLTAAVIAVLVMSTVNVVSVNATVNDTVARAEKEASKTANIPLSKTGKNVVVIMLDRAISCYVPYIMNENSTIKKQFAGFTYYPNTISYGGFTNIASPALYGGYEYTPEEINKRDTVSLKDKQNEALLVMPVNFSEAGYKTTVWNPTYANYQWIPDTSIYDKYPKINAYLTGNNLLGAGSNSGSTGSKAKQIVGTEAASQLESLNRNLFCYGIFRTVPVILREISYDTGLYNDADKYSDNSGKLDKGNTSNEKTSSSSGSSNAETSGSSTKNGDTDKTGTSEKTGTSAQVLDGKSKAKGVNNNFKNEIEVLETLEDVTYLDSSSTGSFFIMSNDATHEVSLLQEPDYKISENVDNTEYDAKHPTRSDGNGGTIELSTEQQLMHYQCNMAALRELGEWFDFLRDNGLYDNTRIIIVSDHGRDLGYIKSIGPEGFSGDVTMYNSVLLVKDFNSTEYKTDSTFMTNADTASIAMNGLISNPVNPSTGKKITNENKKTGNQKILTSNVWETSKNNGNTFLKADWLTVHDNIFNKNNWGLIKDQ